MENKCKECKEYNKAYLGSTFFCKKIEYFIPDVENFGCKEFKKKKAK